MSYIGSRSYVKPVEDVNKSILKSLNNPVDSLPLKEKLSGKKDVMILIEDNTRNTPVKDILEVLLPYLLDNGIDNNDITIMTAPGTHRIMTKQEIIDKVGDEIAKEYRIVQHDYLDKSLLINLGMVKVNEIEIPIEVNRYAVEADFLIGIGSILPHSDAGFSGGAKIVEPGICGYSTTAATHISAALLEEIPLGSVNNPCRQGIEEVTSQIGLDFIINVVKNCQGEIAGVFAGDFIAAHRKGVRLAEKSYGIKIKEKTDIVIATSHPFDLDWWQADKGLISAYFAVRAGGTIIFLTPCKEGLENNHPCLQKWLKKSYKDACQEAVKLDLYKEEYDLIAADLAISNAKIRERNDIFIVTDGLSEEQISVLGYKPYDNLQKAIDIALEANPEATIGILPEGGDILPVIEE